MTNQFAGMTKSKFSSIIFKQMDQTGNSAMTCILDYCERNGLDPIVGASLLTPTLKECVREEASGLRMLKPDDGDTIDETD